MRNNNGLVVFSLRIHASYEKNNIKTFLLGLSLILAIIICGHQSTGQDPLHYYHRSRRLTKQANCNHYLLASSSSLRYNNNRRYTSPPLKDYSNHFIDDEEFQKDKKSRLWNVNLASRQPGKFSWTSKLVLANVLAYTAQVFFPSVTKWGVKLSDKILRGEQLYRLITPVFLHGGLAHLFTNMYSLQNVGHDVEKLFGPGRFLATYLASGAAGNYLSSLQSPNPALGASGAVFGVIGAYYVFLTRNDWLLGRYGQRMTDAITQTIAINLLLGALNPMVDNWGHLGGAIGGAAAAYWFGPRLFLMESPFMNDPTNSKGSTSTSLGRPTVIVDKPLLRLPRTIESIPEQVGKRFRRLPRRIQIDRYKSELEPKPWRREQHPQQQQQQQRRHRRFAPNRSIKPRL